MLAKHRLTSAREGEGRNGGRERGGVETATAVPAPSVAVVTAGLTPTCLHPPGLPSTPRMTPTSSITSGRTG